jgi:hypothetical protein
MTQKRPASGRNRSGRPGSPGGAGRPRAPQPPRAGSQRPPAPKPPTPAPGDAPTDSVPTGDAPVGLPPKLPVIGDVPAEGDAAEWPKPPTPKAARKTPVVPAKGPTTEAAAKREEARAAAKERRMQEQKRKRAAERKRKVRNYSILGGVAVIIIVLIGLGIVGSQHSKQAFTKLSAAAGCGSVQDTSSLPGTTGRTHLTAAQVSAGVTVTYSTSPPSGGDHYPSPLPKGVYDPLSTNPKDNPNLYMAVHSLEHGYVDIWYGPGLSADQISSLKNFASQDKVLVISYPNMPAGKSVAMTTWTRYQACDRVDTAQIQGYIDQYKLKTAPEPAAA